MSKSVTYWLLFISCGLFTTDSRAALTITLGNEMISPTGGTFDIFAEWTPTGTDPAPEAQSTVRTNSFTLNFGMDSYGNVASVTIDDFDVLLTGDGTWSEQFTSIDNSSFSDGDTEETTWVNFFPGNGGDITDDTIAPTPTPVARVSFTVPGGFDETQSFRATIETSLTRFDFPAFNDPTVFPETDPGDSTIVASLTLTGVPEASSCLYLGFVLALCGGFGWWRKRLAG